MLLPSRKHISSPRASGMMVIGRACLQPGAEGMAPKPQGMLFVRVCGATDIPRFDWKSMLSRPDTYVTCVSYPVALPLVGPCGFSTCEATPAMCNM